MALVSVVIPVFNMWHLTANCLQSLARTSPLAELEVIVVDNGSTDATASSCLGLGRQLFGNAFHYLPQVKNKNFGPACNIGAKKASGDFLFFLNNDTILTDNWLPPLLRSLAQNPSLGGVGPLLLYPAIGTYPDRVQHLGVAVNQVLQVHHLYEGIPGQHPLAQRRRFFQAITGAALLLRKPLFDAVDGFDEEFINEFEDVELCIRIGSKGYKFTCEPESVVYHLASQTPGRHAHSAHNAQVFLRKITPHIVPDYHKFVEEDGFEYRFSPWLRAQPCIVPQQKRLFAKYLSPDTSTRLVESLLWNEPFWEDAYPWLARQKAAAGHKEEALSLMILASKLFYNPDNFILLIAYAQVCKDQKTLKWAIGLLFSCVVSYNGYIKYAKDLNAWLAEIGMEKLAHEVTKWLETAELFRVQRLQPITAMLQQCLKHGLLKKD